MTSNIGSKIEKGGGGLGFSDAENQADYQYTNISALVNEELKQYFRPEFLNRLDEIIVFRQLTKMKSNNSILLREVFNRLTEKGITEVTARFNDRLVEEGYNLLCASSGGQLRVCWKTALQRKS